MGNLGRSSGVRDRCSQAMLGETGAPGASISGTVFNLANNIIGAGFLALPYCVKQSSMEEFSLWLLVLGSASAKSFWDLAVCCELTGETTYKGIAQDAGSLYGSLFGQILGKFCQSWAMLYAMLSCVSYMKVATTILVELVDMHGQAFVTLVIFSLVVLPLCCLTRIGPLSYFSSFAIAVTCLMVAYVSDVSVKIATSHPSQTTDHEVFAALPAMTVAFTAHYNGPRYFNELSRDLHSFGWTLIWVFLLSGLIYLFFGNLGFQMFGTNTRSDFLANLDEGTGNLFRCGYLIILWADFPKVFNGIREACLQLCEGLTNDEAAMLNGLNWFGLSCPIFSKLFDYTLALFVLIFTLAYILVVNSHDTLETILNLKGLTFGIPMVYIFPLTFRILLDQSSRMTFLHLLLLLSVLVIYIGIIMHQFKSENA